MSASCVVLTHLADAGSAKPTAAHAECRHREILGPPAAYMSEGQSTAPVSAKPAKESTDKKTIYPFQMFDRAKVPGNKRDFRASVGRWR
eukprot:361217-Prorocentrum_minimum.AAC.2